MTDDGDDDGDYRGEELQMEFTMMINDDGDNYNNYRGKELQIVFMIVMIITATENC